MLTGSNESNILRLQQVKKKTGLSRSSIYAYMKDGSFPQPIKLGLHSVGWLSNEVHGWLEGRISATRSYQATTMGEAS